MGKIVTREEVKLAVDPESRVDARHDVFLDILIAGAEDAVARFCRQAFWPEPDFVDGQDIAPPVAKEFVAPRRSPATLRVPGIREIAAMTLGGSPLTAWRVIRPGAAPANRIRVDLGLWRSYGASLESEVLTIVGRWGWQQPPAAVKTAVMYLVARGFQERKALFSDTVTSAEGVYSYFREVPASVKFQLTPLRVPNVAVLG